MAQATRSERDPAEREADIDTIIDAASFGGELVEALRELATPTELRGATTSVEPVVHRAVQLAFRVARQKLRAAQQPVVDVLGQGFHVEGSSTALTRVVFNLVLNALEAGGPVRLSLTARDGEMQIDVVDGGCGIAPERLASIAEPFVTNKEHGHGLGLSVAAQGASALGGRLGVRSTLGEGTTFRLLLPLRE